MPEFLIAQRYTTSDMWTLFVTGHEVYANSDLGGVISYLRSFFPGDPVQQVVVAVRPLAETMPSYQPKMPTMLLVNRE